jgi:sulfide:quinone oxidoreductase
MNQRPRILIAGGGIAAVELVMALRDLAEERVEIQLLAPNQELVYRPLAVVEPFGLGHVHRFDLDAILADHGATRYASTLASVDTQRRCAVTPTGRELPYDIFVAATGARARAVVPGALTLSDGGFSEFRALLRRLGTRGPERIAFAVPGGVAWALPLYELALMTAAWLRKQKRSGVGIAVVTPEERPLAAFGRRASASVSSLLAENGIDVHGATYPEAFEDRHLAVRPGEPVPADSVVALPRLEGPAIAGLPHDNDGFLPTDLFGRVGDLEDVFAAGDATTFPVKQGGLATQQADTVAACIAARVGAPVTPEPFDPVLRGVLLTGGIPTYLRAELRPGRGDATASETDAEPLWWPPSKVSGRHLGHYLARLAAAEPPAPDATWLRLETDDLEPYMRPVPDR